MTLNQYKLITPNQCKLTILKVVNEKMEQAIYELVSAERDLAAMKASNDVTKKWQDQEGYSLGFGNVLPSTEFAEQRVEKARNSLKNWNEVVKVATTYFINEDENEI